MTQEINHPKESIFDQKINAFFPGSVVRKDLVKAVKGNAIVPSYVLEYLLGQYCATNEIATIQAGIETVRDILQQHYVHRNEAGLVRSVIKEKGRHKVIDRVSVTLNDKDDVYEAEFANLGISGVLVNSALVAAHPKLLVGGVWCICDVEYLHAGDPKVVPWIMGTLKPIQLSNFDDNAYLQARKEFNTEEWIDLLIQSIGFNPEMFGHRAKLLQLIRLIPYCERNYNLIELGPKGTGKSHIYSEFSPHGMLISGGEVTAAKLFVNNSNGRLGLVGYWDSVAFDEFAGKTKRPDNALVDIMKNYMANKSFSRGVETLGAEASMVFVGNTQHTVPYMLKNSDLFSELPAAYHDSAFLDRIHCYIPGWEMDIIRGEMFSEGYGFVVDYIAEILKSMRVQDFSDRYQKYFKLSSDISTRDRDGIHKTFSGLMKILYPSGEATEAEIEEILRLSIEGRKRVKDQLIRIDATITSVRFEYSDLSGALQKVTTLEEDEYPNYYHRDDSQVDEGTLISPAGPLDEAPPRPSQDGNQDLDTTKVPAGSTAAAASGATLVKSGTHLDYLESQKGISFDGLFGPYVRGAKQVTVIDPYIRMFHQVKNLMEFIETVRKFNSEDSEVNVKLLTIEDEDLEKATKQKDLLNQVQLSANSAGITFVYEFDAYKTLHDREVSTDTGWKIVLGRGLDIFQYISNDPFDMATRIHNLRKVKKFGVTYIHQNND